MLGLSQGELATRVGLAFQQIQKYESGADRISASRLFDCAAALETPISWFFEGARSAGGSTLVVRRPRALRLHRAMNDITDPGCRAALTNLVRVLARGTTGRSKL